MVICLTHWEMLEEGEGWELGVGGAKRLGGSKLFLLTSWLTGVFNFVSDRSGETVTVMLNASSNVNVCDNKNKSTPLHLAVIQGNKAGVKALLASPHCDVNCQVNKNGNCLFSSEVEVNHG